MREGEKATRKLQKYCINTNVLLIISSLSSVCHLSYCNYGLNTFLSFFLAVNIAEIAETRLFTKRAVSRHPS